MSDLPEGWKISSAEQVCDIVQSGGTPKKDGFTNHQGIPFLKVYNIVEQKVAFDYRPQFITEEAHRGSGRKSKILPGDVLMNIVGPPLGKVAIVPGDYPEWNCNQALTIFRASEYVSKDWLYYFLCSGIPVSSVLGETRGVVGQVNISLSQCRNFQIPLPPLAEQGRIVEKLDALSAQSAAANAALTRIETLITRYKAAVLGAAFQGKLTAQFRADSNNHRVTDEELAMLRRKVWSARSTKPYKSPQTVEAEAWFDTPPSWRWCTVDQVVAIVQYGSSSKTSSEGDVPVLRMGNIQFGELDYTNLKYLPGDHDEFPELLLEDGDVLFNRTNSAELVGKSAVFRFSGQPVSFASYLIRVVTSAIDPQLLTYFLNSALGRKWIADVVSQQVGQANVNGTKLKELSIPLPPLEEQAEIVARIEAAFAQIETLARATAAARARLTQLDRALLTKAFQGKLAPQNPKDEPSRELLKRMKEAAI